MCVCVCVCENACLSKLTNPVERSIKSEVGTVDRGIFSHMRLHTTFPDREGTNEFPGAQGQISLFYILLGD